ncbi:MAG: phosphate ABC transporter ATP-binding protein [Clostridia bacterium]|nr:phosphate ABC transporter ATP-binding protein [Clostridia bacterium]
MDNVNIAAGVRTALIPPPAPEAVFDVRNLNLWYGPDPALRDVTLPILKNEVTAVIGPSGCGKSTFVKVLNRMVEQIPSVRITGSVLYHGEDIFSREIEVEHLRTQVGMVFQKPNPFPKSIYENVALGPRRHGIRDRRTLDGIVERCLRDAALWDEVKDRLRENAYALSGGQQQRLCIARSLSLEPDVLLLDEPTSALDPVSSYKVEDLVDKLKERYTIVIVTHSMQQASRISDRTAFFLSGEVVEFNRTEELFSNPSDPRTADYVTGRFG